MRNVGDVNAELKAAIGKNLDVDGVVEIPCRASDRS